MTNEAQQKAAPARRPGRASRFEPTSSGGAAAGALRFLRKRKAKLLADVAAERKTPQEAELAIERAYATLVRQYLRVPETTYAAWLEAGCRDELEEFREARRDDATWDRLVETYAQRVGIAPPKKHSP